MNEPSVIDLKLFHELLVEQVQRGEITDAEAIRCWQIHAVPMIHWLGRKAATMRAAR